METVAQEILAWRGWRVVHDDTGWWLHSVSMMHVRWEGPSVVADGIPADDNSYTGIHALKGRDAILASGYAGSCFGEVALSGVVVEGSNGYRAERATIRSLTLLGYPAPDVRPIEVMMALEERYQCEVAWEEQAQIVNKAAAIQYAINVAAQQNSALSFAPTKFPNYSTQFPSNVFNGLHFI